MNRLRLPVGVDHLAARRVGFGDGQEPLPQALMDRASVPIRNTRNEIVGEVRPVA